ncbi:MAG: hypothetical protein PHX24_11610 [Acidithiobacillus sp.]|nr:hypothetical protein [Acidithiobacillus sp.]
MYDFAKITEEKKKEIISKSIARAHNVTLFAEELGCEEDDLIKYLETQGIRECPACGTFKSARDFPLDEVMCNHCRGGVKMQDWILRYKETVYCIANGEVTEHIIASGLSMRDALDLQSQGRLFPTREAARAHIGKTGEKWTNRINPHLHG